MAHPQNTAAPTTAAAPDDTAADNESDTESDDMAVSVTSSYFDEMEFDIDDFFDHFPSAEFEWLDRSTLRDHWNFNLWERPGMLHDHFESSYLPSVARPRYVKRYTVNYEMCTPQELKRFVKDRGLQDPCPGKVTLKYYYIRVLERADRNPQFGLMGLPAELRTWVYGSLLTLESREKPGWVCHPQILQTCREVYREAKKALYDGNEMYCKLDSIQNDCCGELAQYAFVNHQFYAPDFPGSRYRTANFPEYLSRFSHLRINAEYAIEGASKFANYEGISHMFCAFASFLMESHSLKTLSIEFKAQAENPQALEDIVYEHIFYPLLRLRKIGKVKITSNVDNFPAHIQHVISANTKSPLPAFNTWKYWELLHDEGGSWLAVLKASDPTSANIPAFKRVQQSLHKLHGMEMESCLTSRLEMRFKYGLRRFRQLLEQAKEDHVVEMVQRWAKSRLARNDFEDASGRKTIEDELEDDKEWMDLIFALDSDDEYEFEDDSYDTAHDWTIEEA